ncbi:sensor histidine kinase [Luteimicrobium sp. DT211]|uniref:sensor histidine kinase n=1 Tax=Luteimicrobium sp. DT211 TaxID=3393412 RepID=UPI003CF5DCFE
MSARRRPGLSVRWKLTLSYAGFLIVAGAGLIAVVLVFLLRYVPDQAVVVPRTLPSGNLRPGSLFIPGRSDLWAAFAPKAALMLLLLLVVGLAGGWLLAGRVLAPLARITDATRRAADGSLSYRIRLPGRDDEFRELADGFDSMLARLEALVAEQQRFAANASHELRTPLAITQTLLDVAANDPDRDADALLARLRVVNTRAIDLTEALLLLSRADQGEFERERVDLSLLAEEATETLLPLAERRGVALAADGVAAPVLGSPALLLQLTTNLVHNAIVHNLRAGGTVRVTTARADAASVTLTVENTGAELDPALVGGLTERFRRGSDRVRTDHEGVGLGLAIVKSITRAHGGTLALAPRPGGGLRVVVHLPATP